jgi:hypothetical protein
MLAQVRHRDFPDFQQGLILRPEGDIPFDPDPHAGEP